MAPDLRSLPTLRSARRSIDKAIIDARLGRGIRYDTWIAQATLRALLDELEATA
jgi:hypothetical protein